MDHVLEVDIFTKQCKVCFLIVKPDTLSHGLFNIGDMVLVTCDIFFTLQNMIRFVMAVKLCCDHILVLLDMS